MRNIIVWLFLFTIITISSIVYSSIPFAPYVDITLNNAYHKKSHTYAPADLIKSIKSAGIKNIRMAFIIDASHCKPSWKDSRLVSKKWAASLFNRMQKNGINYAISFGGPVTKDLSANCTLPQLISNYEMVIHFYHPTGLDFDIERRDTDISKMLQALQNIQKKYPQLEISFTLPVFPTGLNDSGKFIVQSAQQAGLKFIVNLMTMNYGRMFTEKTMSGYAIDAATSVHDFLKVLYPQLSDADLWNMLELTPMIGKNSMPNEIFTLTDVDNLREFAKEKNIHHLSMWSINRDHPCAYSHVSPTCTSNNLQTEDYEFAKRFMRE